MSLLSDTMGKPHRVLALVRLLHTAGGRLPLKDAERWLAPPLRTRAHDRSDLVVLEEYKSRLVGAAQTIGAGRSLGLVKDDGDDLLLTAGVPPEPAALAAWVHDRLVGVADEHPDAIVLRVYAWTVLDIERHGGYTTLERSQKELANDIEATLNPDRGPEDARMFNPTKLPAWREWAAFIGLGLDSIPSLPAFMPAAATAVGRALRRVGEEKGFDTDIAADELVDALSQPNRAPYLDRGRILGDMARLARHSLERGKLTIVLSDALRTLHEEGALELRSVGDARRSLRLSAHAGQTPMSVVSIVVRRCAGGLHGA